LYALRNAGGDNGFRVFIMSYTVTLAPCITQPIQNNPGGLTPSSGSFSHFYIDRKMNPLFLDYN